jgi:hypothetical protein
MLPVHGRRSSRPSYFALKKAPGAARRSAGRRKVVLRLETASLGFQGHDLPLERRSAMATRFFGRSLPDSNIVRVTSLTDASDAPDDQSRKHRGPLRQRVAVIWRRS